MTASEPPDATNDAAAAMLWEEARRLIARQEAVLDTLRNQAVAILSVAAIVAGLFGSRIVATQPSAFVMAMVGAALVLFGATVWLVITILRPRKWTFEHTLTQKLRMLERGVLLESGSLGFTWAKDVERWRAANKPQLDRLMTFFLWACALTAGEVIFWGLALL
ncbi:MAG TPA: hypothetical protein VND98_11750 [Solirubrobacterales bacterium]|nr:hypothetical protein [Solirubrobacterales bacterium]